MQLYVDRPMLGRILGVTGYTLLFISWAADILGRILWPSLFAPWPCVKAPYGCGLAFIAGILALILNLKRWPSGFFLSNVAFMSFAYIGLTISDI